MSNSLVKCRYKHCDKLHGSNDKLEKDEAVRCGNGFYYHPDCYHMKTTIEEIRDLFIKHIDPAITGKQVGYIVKTINYIVFDKGVDAEYLKFCLVYYIKNKPGALKYPGGLHYIFNKSDIQKAWKQYNDLIIRNQLEEQRKELENKQQKEEPEMDLPDTSNIVFKNRRTKFSSVIGA